MADKHESEPLTRGSGTDASALLAQAVRLRVPRPSASGPFEAPRKVPSRSVRKGQRFQRPGEEEVPLELDCAPACPPSTNNIVAALLHHLPATVIQCIYIGGAYVVYSVSGSTLQEEEKELAADTNGAYGLRDSSGAAAARCLWYWVVYAGLVAGVMLAFENSYSVVSEVFVTIERLNKLVQQAVDTLLVELPRDVEQMLTDGMESTTKTRASAAEELAAAIGIAVQHARKDLVTEKLLPSQLQSQCLCTLAALALPLAVVLLKFFIDAAMGPPQDVAEARRLAGFSAGDFWGRAGLLWSYVLLNCVWSLMSTWPVQRFLSCNVLVRAQHAANAKLYATVVATIPGGVNGLQDLMDKMESEDSGSGGSGGKSSKCAVQ